MSHDHGHDHHHNATKNITVAFILNLSFSIIELVGGLWTSSIAILSDALHDFGDSISLGVAWYLQKISEKKPDANYSYGYKRFSLLGAVFISFVLLVGSVFIIKESVERIITPSSGPYAEGMFFLAIFGVLVNGAAAFRLKKGTSMNERAVTIHLLEDVFGWLAVLVVSVVMMFVNVPVLDPLLSVGISLWVLFNVYRNLKGTFKILLQEVPKDIDLKKLEDKIVRIPAVHSIHDVHLWSLDGEVHILTMHVVTDADSSDKWRDLKNEIHRLCRESGIPHTTIEFETSDENCTKCELDF